MLTMERQTPDLPLAIAIIAHTVIVAALIWNSAIAIPPESMQIDQPKQTESTTDILMLVDNTGDGVKPASMMEEQQLPHVPEFPIRDLSAGDVLTIAQKDVIADTDGMWAIPANPVRDTTPREVDIRELAAAPRFTALSRAPTLRNGQHIQRYLNKNFPMALRRAGGEILVVVWLLVDTQGKVFKAVLPRTSGRNDADSVAVEATYLMEFEPAEQAGRLLPVWVQQPVRFRVQDVF